MAKAQQRVESRCATCGEYPGREMPFHIFLWGAGVSNLRDLDLTPHFVHPKFFLSVTRNDSKRNDDGYRRAIDERRKRDGDDSADLEKAKKLGYEASHSILVVFPFDVDKDADAVLWVRRFDGVKGWQKRTALAFSHVLKEG